MSLRNPLLEPLLVYAARKRHCTAAGGQVQASSWRYTGVSKDITGRLIARKKSKRSFV